MLSKLLTPASLSS